MRNKGITLVALVITIIILLILAGITISQLTGSGLFENAKLAEQKSKEAQEKEDGILNDYENKIGEYVDASRGENNNKIYKIGTYESVSVSASANMRQNMVNANTIEINIKEKYGNYKKLTKDNFLAVDSLEFIDNDMSSQYIAYHSYNSEIVEYNAETGILKVTKTFGIRDDASNSLDKCYLGSTTIYLIENSNIPEV